MLSGPLALLNFEFGELPFHLVVSKSQTRGWRWVYRVPCDFSKTERGGGACCGGQVLGEEGSRVVNRGVNGDRDGGEGSRVVNRGVNGDRDGGWGPRPTV